MKKFLIFAFISLWIILIIIVSSNKIQASTNILRGQNIVKQSNCESCHGVNLDNPVSNEYPKIAGQYADYIYLALLAYQQYNTNNFFGRDNPIMRSQVQNFSKSEMHDIADYIQSLPSTLSHKPVDIS